MCHASLLSGQAVLLPRQSGFAPSTSLLERQLSQGEAPEWKLGITEASSVPLDLLQGSLLAVTPQDSN